MTVREYRQEIQDRLLDRVDEAWEMVNENYREPDGLPLIPEDSVDETPEDVDDMQEYLKQTLYHQFQWRDLVNEISMAPDQLPIRTLGTGPAGD